ncbi:MAG: hypothetical protein JNJ48_08305 [Phycisphaerae bacterium]|nr:hypothetical protein [Phycisphaerae bacterium]
MPHLTLAIETSNPPSPGGGSVALGLVERAGPEDPAGRVEVLGVEPLRPVDRDRDDLMPAIDRLVRRAGRAPAEVSLVAVSMGPGGFTALRVACATGKLIATATGGGTPALCVAVPSALSAALSAPADARSGPLAVALAAKAGVVHLTLLAPGFERKGSAPAGRLADAAAIAALSPAGVMIADRHLPAEIRAAATRIGWRVVEPSWDARSVLAAAAHVPTVQADALNPLYAREPEAVTLWRARHGGGGAAG